jgi:hypothetical protein
VEIEDAGCGFGGGGQPERSLELVVFDVGHLKVLPLDLYPFQNKVVRS